MTQFGICRDHGLNVKMLNVCTHLIKEHNLEYIIINDKVILCVNCINISLKKAQSICVECFAELKLQNNLNEVIKH